MLNPIGGTSFVGRHESSYGGFQNQNSSNPLSLSRNPLVACSGIPSLPLEHRGQSFAGAVARAAGDISTSRARVHLLCLSVRSAIVNGAAACLFPVSGLIDE
ncbi:MAG: hypothetical protein LH628_25535 [Microcoleus sp. CAN_BIN18]|nr:hypothetical protein [Microcoleus sp. CAN_BIN18]